MPQTYSDGNNIYNVDMMFAYFNIFRFPVEKIIIDDKLLRNLEFKGWGDPEKKIYYSPHEVLKNPKKYDEEYARIKMADLKFPIIVHNDIIVDGVHRLCKAYMLEKKNIKAYRLTNKTIKKFLINSHGNHKIANNITSYELIELFFKRFSRRSTK